MGMPSSYSKTKWLLPLAIPLLFTIAVAVEFLPGFQGPLPFQLETGYVGVDEGEDLQVYYYFVKSESNPEEDPLILWLTGGPGCSGLTGLVFEIGPLMFKMVEYNGSLPTLLYNPISWTKMASILFLDLPMGTGFTYRRSAVASNYSIHDYTKHGYEFFTKWLSDHPEFISNKFYVGGDSYAGLPIPVIAQLISDANEAGQDRYINLKGYILGNPVTFSSENNYKVGFAHDMGLIPDDFLESIKMYCGGEYRKDYVDPSNLQCLRWIKAYDVLMERIQPDQVLEPECGGDYLSAAKSFRERALAEQINEPYNPKLYSQTAFPCRNEGYALAMYWANDKSVRNALHIRKGSIKKWKRCNKTLTTDPPLTDVRPYHVKLSRKGYRALIYSGDHDMVVPHQSTQAWIRDLNYSITDQWRSWRVANHQVAGYTRSYSNNLTFATVKGGGHTAPEYKPEECFTMFKRWISHKPL